MLECCGVVEGLINRIGNNVTTLFLSLSVIPRSLNFIRIRPLNYNH